MKTPTVCLLILCAACVLGQVPMKTPGIDFLSHFVDALNSKNEATIRLYLQANATDDVPLDQRTQRMTEFASQYGPFRLEPKPVMTGGDLHAVLFDKNKSRLNVIVALTPGDPPKIRSIRIMPFPYDGKFALWDGPQKLAALLLENGKIPAMGITLISHGKLETGVAGVRVAGGKIAVGPDEPWSVGSIGKPICTTLIGRLIEKGKLRWDETLGEALKGVPMQRGYESVTLEQIMQHRGGIPQDLDFTRDRLLAIVGSARTPTAMRERYARDILHRAPIARPGERNAYSNAGYALLGHIAERVTGKPYEVLVKEMVFVPLGLKNSYTGIDKLPSARPSGHVKGPTGLTPANMSGALEYLAAPAGGGIYMSTADLARFGAAHLKGLHGQDGLLKAATVERLHKGLPEHEGDPFFLYACGWGIEANPEIETFHGHNGSNGTMRAQLAIFPKADLVVAAVTNCGGEEEPSPSLRAVLDIAEHYGAQTR